MPAAVEPFADLITTIPWLAALDRPDLERIATTARHVDWHDGEVVVREGDHGTTCYVLVAGGARVQRDARDGRRITVARLEAPAAFGELSLLAGGPRTATVEAIGPSSALELQADDVLPPLRRNAAAALGLAQLLAERLRIADEKVIGYALGTAAGGVAATLLAWVEARRSQGAGSADVEVVGGPIDVARSSGVSRQATERFLDHLEVEGVVSVRRGRTIVHRPEALLEYLG